MTKYFFVLPLMLVISCAGFNNIVSLQNYQYDYVAAVCDIKKIKNREVSEEEKKVFSLKADKRTYVYAQIEFTNLSGQARLVNPKSYYLSLNNKKSDSMVIDSYIDYIIMPKQLRPNEPYKISVYWVFDGELSEADVKKIELIYQQ